MTRIVNLATANTKLLEDSSQLLQISSALLREIQIRLCCRTRRDAALGIKISPSIVELVFPSKNRRTLKDRPREFHDEKIAALALPISPGARSESIYQAFEEEDVAFLTLRDANCSRSNGAIVQCAEQICPAHSSPSCDADYEAEPLRFRGKRWAKVSRAFAAPRYPKKREWIRRSRSGSRGPFYLAKASFA